MTTGNSDTGLTLCHLCLERALGSFCRREVLHRHAMHPHLRLRPLSCAGSVKLDWKGGMLILPTYAGHSISTLSHLGGATFPRINSEVSGNLSFCPALGPLASESGPHTTLAFLASSSVLNKSQRKRIVCLSYILHLRLIFL